MLGNAKDAMMIVQGTSTDAEDVVMVVVMTRMITILTPPFSSWSSSSLIRQHW